MMNENNVNPPEWLVEEMTNFLYSNGLVMKKEQNEVIHIPTIIFPTPVYILDNLDK